MQEIDSRGRAGQCFAGNAGEPAALAADGHIEALVAVLAEAFDGHVLPYFDAGTDIHADLAHNVDFSLDNVFLQLVGRDSVAEHAARLFVLLEYSGLVPHRGQIVGTAQAGRAAADDGDFLFPVVLDVGADVHFGNETRLCLQVLLGDEFLHGVDGDGLVDGPACAGVLAAAVADASAYGRERILALDQLQRFSIFSFRSLFQIALDGDVRRAGRLARRSAGRIAVDAVPVAVVLIPLVRAPFGGVGQLLFRIGYGAVLRTKFLAEFHGTGRAVFHTPAAGHAAFRIDPRHIGTAREVGRIEQLRGSQCIANLYVAVADRENLSFPVDIGNLVHEAVVLRFLEDGHRLVVGNVMAASRLGTVVCHVAHGEAPVAIVVGAALVHLLAAVAAGADSHAEMPLVALEPIGKVLDVHRLIFHRDGFLHGDDVHADAGAAHRDHRGNLFQRQEGHPLEEHGQLGMAVHQVGVHVRVFGGTRHEERNPVDTVFPVVRRTGNRAVLGVFVAVVVFDHAEIRQLVEQFIERCVIRRVMLFSIPLMEKRIRPVFADFQELFGQHVQQQVQSRFTGRGVHLILKDAGQAPVFRGVRGHLDLAGHTVGDVAHELEEFGIRVLVALVLGDELR